MHGESLERVHRVIAALSHRVTAKEVADALVREVVDAVGACASRVGLFVQGGGFQAVSSFGYPQELVAHWAARRVTDSPMMREVWRGQSVFARRCSEDPRVDPKLAQCFGDGAVCVVPIVVAGAPIGYLSVAFDHAREFEPEERDFIHLLATHCGQSLERARLFEAERAARAAADSARRELETVLNQLPVAVVIANRDGHVVLNDAVRSIYGTQMRTTNLNNYTTGHTRHLDGRAFGEGELPIPRAFQGEQTQGLLALITLVDGSTRTVSVNAGPVRSDTGEITAAVAAFTDVTERQKLLDDLRDAVTARDDFLSIAAHELRNPLAALGAQLLGLEQMALDEGRRAQKLSAAQRQVRRLSGLVEELLNVSRIVHGRLSLECERTDLAQVVVDATDRMAEDFARGGTPLDVEAAGPVFGHWDRLRLDLVVTNLLSNALRYGRKQPVRVRIEAEAEVARVLVEDRGIGIKAEDQTRIFERFVRAVPGRSYGGLGIGLWLSRQIVDGHGGRLRLESGEGEGARFTVELPR